MIYTTFKLWMYIYIYSYNISREKVKYKQTPALLCSTLALLSEDMFSNNFV